MPLHHWVDSKGRIALAAHTWVHPFWADDRPQPREFGGWGSRHLVVVHGACEHSGRYQKLAETCHSRGWNVTTFDFRGHGQSSGRRVDIASFHDYVDDLRAVISQLGASPASICILAHSMGALVVLRALQTGAIDVGKIVFSSPLIELKIPIPIWKLALGRALLWVAPQTRFTNQITVDQLTHDQQIIEDRKEDPFLESEVTARWFFATQDARHLLWKCEPISPPLLLLQAEQDKIVSPEASRRFFDQFCAQNPESKFLTVEGAYHELLNEIGREKTIELFLDWLDDVDSPLAEGTAEQA